jgi:glycosyltransferase involved in cell wall biosynthesis
MEMTPNEAARWHAHQQTPITYNHHATLHINATTVQEIDLNEVTSSPEGLQRKERILVLTPLRNAGDHIPKYFDLVSKLTYPHSLIDFAFLVSDSTDDTKAILAKELARVQNDKDIAFRSATIIAKDFGVTLDQEVHERHSWEAQAPRRKSLGRARNYLLSAALKPDHSWVYWRDVDINDSPGQIIEDFIAHDRDVLVPNIWFHRYKKNDEGKVVDIEGRCKWLWLEARFVLQNIFLLTKRNS